MSMRKNTLGVKKLTALVVPLALAVLLAACGGTGSPADDPDPYHIGRFGGIEVRVAPGIVRSHGYIALEALKDMELTWVKSLNYYAGIDIIEIMGPAAGMANGTRDGNIIRGTLGSNLNMSALVSFALANIQ